MPWQMTFVFLIDQNAHELFLSLIFMHESSDRQRIRTPAPPQAFQEQMRNRWIFGRLAPSATYEATERLSLPCRRINSVP